MAEEQDAETEPKKKASKLPLILGVVFALLGGGGSFFAVYSGMLLGSDEDSHAGEPAADSDSAPDVAFVAIEPLIIGLGQGRNGRFLRFRAQLEVASNAVAEVEKLAPRVVDVMNTFLRAVDIEDLQDSTALVRLRAQLLRRVQVVTGPNRVRDLLIMEFVVS